VKRARAVLVSIALGLVVGGRGHAVASPPPASLSLVAAPVFGADAATGTGWNEVVVRVDNTGTRDARGMLELSMSQAWISGDLEAAARAPFAVPAGRSALVQLPTHGFAYYAPQVLVSAKTDAGETLTSVNVPINGQSAPLLVEVEEPARLSNALRGWPVPTTWQVATSSSSSNVLTVGSPGFDRATGDAILPERPSGYAAATAVVIRSSRLVALDQVRRDALVDWVTSGGTLAIAPARPEDLRSPVIASLVGGEASADAPPAHLLQLPAYAKPEAQTLKPAPAPHAHGKPKSSPSSSPNAEDEPRILRVGPSPTVGARLAGYVGGDLQPSDFGATATHGLGEVHLLAFDPTLPDAADDPWVQSRIVDLLARAWDHRARVAFPVGGGERNVGRIDEVRRALDPNENFRLGLGASALLLLVYSAVVGPLVFSRAAKRGRPLLPLVWVPAWSAVAFGAIVVIGLAEKGWRGRSRRVTLVEAGSGASLAAARAYRGFYASETRSLSVAPIEQASVLEVAPTGGMASHTSYGALRIDRAGLTLGEVTSLPWETVVIREDGMRDLHGGVALTTSATGDVAIDNRSGHALENVIVHTPTAAAYFASIADGAHVSLASGRALGAGFAIPTTAGTYVVHALGAQSFAASLGPVGKHMEEAWAALETAAGDGVDWWPDDAPVLIGEVALGPHAPSDSGLGLESDRVFVRILGARQEAP
jgi:hypothetical protein